MQSGSVRKKFGSVILISCDGYSVPTVGFTRTNDSMYLKFQTNGSDVQQQIRALCWTGGVTGVDGSFGNVAASKKLARFLAKLIESKSKHCRERQQRNC